MTREELKKKALSLPLQPGVYLMMNAQGQVIYVGKAKALKNRVSQYFQDTASHTAKTVLMVSQIDHFDTIIASSEFEALVLECSLIKQYMPRYNILLKDDKGYPFVRVDLREAYPEFQVVSRVEKDGARYFGPLGGRGATFDALRAVGEVFHLPDCGKKFPRDIGKERPCLNQHLGRCMAPCTGQVSQEEYHQVIEQVAELLSGRHQEVAEKIRREMEEAAAALEFERAALLRDRYQGICRLGTRQRVLSAVFSDRDVVGCFQGAKKAAVAILHFRGGHLTGRDLTVFPSGGESAEELVGAVVKQTYLRQGSLPRELLLPCPLEDQEPLEAMLTERAEHRVSLSVPQRGDRRRLVELAEKNAREEVERLTTGEERSQRSLEELQQALGLPELPRRIEAFDISNTGGTEIVAGMTVFQDAQPRKKDYRTFRIRTTAGQDDYHAMQEAVSRRFQRAKEGDSSFSQLPDLLLIDGGAVHADAARQVLEELEINLPVWGMVKDDRHRTRALINPDGQEAGLSGSPVLFSLVGRIQEETHRFAITYHRKLRSRRGYASALDAIPGVGPARKRQLLRTFQSVKAVREASREALEQAVGPALGAVVYAYFHGQNKDGEENGK